VLQADSFVAPQNI